MRPTPLKCSKVVVGFLMLLLLFLCQTMTFIITQYQRALFLFSIGLNAKLLFDICGNMKSKSETGQQREFHCFISFFPAKGLWMVNLQVCMWHCGALEDAFQSVMR